MLACHDAPQVISHMTEIQIVLCDSKVSLKRRYLLSQDEQLLDDKKLPIQRAAVLGHKATRGLQHKVTKSTVVRARDIVTHMGFAVSLSHSLAPNSMSTLYCCHELWPKTVQIKRAQWCT